jgi:hypothetical protein
MQKLPFRTNDTHLSNDELILLDISFRWGIAPHLLRRKYFCAQWGLDYSHNLDDSQLRCRLRWLCEHGVLEVKQEGKDKWLQITKQGFRLWSQERCPIWDRYCTVDHILTGRGREVTRVLAGSPQIRDDFLRLWPNDPVRLRRATIADYGLVPWHPFNRLYAGVAWYEENVEWTSPDEVDWGRVEAFSQERTWWDSVPELQKFLPDIRWTES